HRGVPGHADVGADRGGTSGTRRVGEPPVSAGCAEADARGRVGRSGRRRVHGAAEVSGLRRGQQPGGGETFTLRVIGGAGEHLGDAEFDLGPYLVRGGAVQEGGGGGRFNGAQPAVLVGDLFGGGDGHAPRVTDRARRRNQPGAVR